MAATMSPWPGYLPPCRGPWRSAAPPSLSSTPSGTSPRSTVLTCTCRRWVLGTWPPWSRTLASASRVSWQLWFYDGRWSRRTRSWRMPQPTSPSVPMIKLKMSNVTESTSWASPPRSNASDMSCRKLVNEELDRRGPDTYVNPAGFLPRFTGDVLAAVNENVLEDRPART
ncbi:uncharacterized protein PV06_03905 [Exophiala oligosperma]|uniref:Uncharacterized protein n=1 Tax=Exophiala oligosperma TaxID=215243 RepID=A0A0D2EC63_9EURO|nr:uncharacterized protein PV06_03905 [Exophiala oligosperma]KIW45519.1 hypothetical protein PV06_03905 [Exophiala oligosperma]